jgi:enoyl-CoA hydratase/carnithine racemase
MDLLQAPETLLLETHADGVLQVTLNRPDVGNAINTRMGQELLDLWLRLTNDAQGVRCVVLTGAGSKIFCAGGDLKERNGMTRAQWTNQHEIFERVSWALADLPLSVRQIKKSIRYGGQMELRTAYRFEVEAYNQLVDTEDRREGVLAFNEKRPPHFKGQ